MPKSSKRRTKTSKKTTRSAATNTKKPLTKSVKKRPSTLKSKKSKKKKLTLAKITPASNPSTFGTPKWVSLLPDSYKLDQFDR